MFRRNGATAVPNAPGGYIDKALIELRKIRQARVTRKTKYKSQEKLTQLLEGIFKCEAEREKTFSWLISPRGAKLRLDIYFASLKLAVEYQGKQHAEFPNRFHKTAEDFRYAAMCDEWKRRLLEQRGIKIIEFTHKDKLTRQSVIEKLKSLGVIA